MTEHVLVFGAGYDIPARLRAKSTDGRPVRTSVLCWPSHLGKLEDVDGNERVILLPETAPLSEWLAAARAVDRHDKVTRVATIYDDCRAEGAAVAAELRLPGVPPELIELVDDKGLMRSLLASSGVERIPHVAVLQPADIGDHTPTPPLPVVVKPLAGEASKGVTVVREAEAFGSALVRAKNAAREGKVIVETYLDGPQFSVEAFSERGQHRPLALTKKYSDPCSLVEIGHVMPAPIDEEDRKRIFEHVERVLEALGITDGPTHTEVVLTSDGPRTIETHLRTGGDELWNMVTDATGVDMIELQIAQILGESVLGRIDATLADGGVRPAQAIWFGVPPSAGTLLRVDGTDRISSEVQLELLSRAGHEFTGLQHSDSRVAQARASAASAEQAVEKARRAVARLELVVTHSAAPTDTV